MFDALRRLLGRQSRADAKLAAMIREILVRTPPHRDVSILVVKAGRTRFAGCVRAYAAADYVVDRAGKVLKSRDYDLSSGA